jgi:serine protease AprX
VRGFTKPDHKRYETVDEGLDMPPRANGGVRLATCLFVRGVCMNRPARSAITNGVALSVVLLTVVVVRPLARPVAASTTGNSKFDLLVQERAARASGFSTVIMRLQDGQSAGSVAAAITAAGGRLQRSLPSISSHVVTVPNAALSPLAANPLIVHLSLDRPIAGSMERTSGTVGATDVRQQLGYDGAGIGVAIIDSGVAPTLDDLNDASGAQRVVRFVDFVGGATGSTTLHDEYGHGTHVAGIVAGNGFDSSGARTGIAPASSLTILKVLNASGTGQVSDVIAAIEYAIAHRDELKIRIINLSVATGVYESFTTDPLTLAAEQAVKAGIVVVASAGNNGISPDGRTRYRGVTAPGNAPWVLTVGASSHMGTVGRGDDSIAEFSSRGPTAIDQVAKPDVVAPGVGIESLSAPSSALALAHPGALLPGTVAVSYLPYMSLSGTSMSAPVVSGTVALMLQANPALTPNQVKAILQYTAETSAFHDPLTQGGGYLNAKGAVELARYLRNPSTSTYPDASRWAARLIWGNYLVQGGRLTAAATAWSTDVRWGAQSTSSGKGIDWGVLCVTSLCDVTSTRWSWIKTAHRNVVWGDVCAGTDCVQEWTLSLVSGADDGETVVWGTTDDGETVVWGTIDDGETVVWGTDDGETVVWGTTCAASTCLPIVWGR